MKPRSTFFHETKHLSENELLPYEPVCPLCDSTERTPIAVLQRQPDVFLMSCHGCGASSASRIPTPQTLDDYYCHYYESSARCYEERVTFDSPERFGRHFAERILHDIHKSRLRILDMGGGDGTIAVQTALILVQNGFEQIDITVVDYNDALTVPDDRRISMIHQKNLDDIASERYDFVVASAVIEHIPYPKTVILKLLELLNNGGIFYARTPYIAPFVRLFQKLGIPFDFTFPAHLHDLGPYFWNTFIQRHADENHFRIIESRPSIVETSFVRHPARTLAAHIFKAPWHVLGNSYPFVGGWEIFLQKIER